MTDDMLAMQERLAERQELERLRAEVKLWRWRAVDAWGEINNLRQREAQLGARNVMHEQAYNLGAMGTPGRLYSLNAFGVSPYPGNPWRGR